ncbi:hypothetical protein B0H16DRAFT_1465304 [Mycena metata]|uniref:Uncharacterized protein n=1 Tax=Mycena metata TaxID=1033252 RepID=A0AAD7IBV2_9AGAR|nr:hypothetical protein B0H16DRAFT_1465304 [Mycena metata]
MSLIAKLLKQMTVSPATPNECRPYLLPGYLDLQTGFEGCGVPFYAPPEWTESFHGTKGYWVVTRHENQGIYVKSSWAWGVEGPDVYVENFATLREALHRMARVCAQEHAIECRIRNGGRLLGPYQSIPAHQHITTGTSVVDEASIESGDMTIDATFMAELQAAEAEYGIVLGDGADTGDEGTVDDGAAGACLVWRCAASAAPLRLTPPPSCRTPPTPLSESKTIQMAPPLVVKTYLVGSSGVPVASHVIKDWRRESGAHPAIWPIFAASDFTTIWQNLPLLHGFEQAFVKVGGRWEQVLDIYYRIDGNPKVFKNDIENIADLNTVEPYTMLGNRLEMCLQISTSTSEEQFLAAATIAISPPRAAVLPALIFVLDTSPSP